MTHLIQPVILCGGSGSRLWPLSRAGFPKQFLSLDGKDSLFQQAAKRLVGLQAKGVDVAKPIIVTGEEHRFLAAEQLRETEVEVQSLLLEPVGRNTAPALTIAALAAQENEIDPVLVVVPSDQTLTNPSAFGDAVHRAVEVASGGGIAIFGIAPDAPATGFGYIQADKDDRQAHMNVKRFVEKPDAASARQYLADGDYYWNAGMFVLKASVWLRALRAFRPDILDAAKVAWDTRTIDLKLATSFVRPGRDEFEAIPSESIDYAVMEHCSRNGFPLHMIPLDAGWSDLGSWDAVWKALPKDELGNALHGDVLATESRNTLVHASSRLVSLVGVENLVVIETADAVLVADKTRCQDVKSIVSELQGNQRQEHAAHRKVHRPWGWYDSIDEGDGFKVKRIQVNPGASLSLQKHHHRAEHWVVVKGTAEVTNGDVSITLGKNQSTFIGVGQLHRLSNSGATPLEIIEVQSGSYLGEDDIVRLEDNYGRREGGE